MRNRPGTTSLAELVLVAWLFALVMGAVAGFATQQRRLAELQRDRLRLEEAVRTGAVVLGTELRHLTAGDVSAGADSVRIRAFRGGGPVCETGADVLHLLYSGVRMPEPAKDSVLLVHGGVERVVSLEATGASSACGGSVRLRLGEPVEADSAGELGMAWIFETGAYSLAAGAIRYRRGEGGRQPLTEVVLREMGFGGSSTALSMRLAPDPDSLPGVPRAGVILPLGSLNHDPSP
jgi:hypothetical protein